MRWELKKSTGEHEIYHLTDGEKKLLSLEINRYLNSARIICENEKRVFVIRKKELARNRMSIRNEYGIKVGELGSENRARYIDMNDERFYYKFRNSELVLYRNLQEAPIFNCSVDTKDAAEKSEKPHPGLLIALCWYLFLPISHAQTAELAT
jgi:hypothetical protein